LTNGRARPIVSRVASRFSSRFAKVLTVADQWQTLVLELILLAGWVAWWLWAVNWVHAWDWLARGAWVAVLLLVFLGALVWSRIDPKELDLTFTRLPNFWWQLGGTAVLACIALFCGWLQGVAGWMPADIPIYPADPTHDETGGHEHPVGALHGHDNYHEDEPQAGHNGHGHGGHH
jgi:hypothetical protein